MGPIVYVRLAVDGNMHTRTHTGPHMTKCLISFQWAHLQISISHFICPRRAITRAAEQQNHKIKHRAHKQTSYIWEKTAGLNNQKISKKIKDFLYLIILANGTLKKGAKH